jgi:hypothetical protein
MVEIGFVNLIEHADYERGESRNDLDSDGDFWWEKEFADRDDYYENGAKKMLLEWTDGDRFAGWLESDFEEYCDENDIECDDHFEALETFYDNNTEYITNQINELA